MPRIEPELQRLQEIKTLPSLIKYLKDDLNWPIGSDDVESVVFDYDPAELGFDSASTAKIEEVCQLRPLTPGQKWGVFWVKFGKKQLPVQMLRRALGNLVVKKRTSTKKADKAAWHMHDLLFISAYGDDSNRHITFAHFSESEDSEKSLPVLKVLGWDEDDTLLHLKDTYKTLVTCLNWETTPTDDPEAWREHWSKAFKLTHKEVINTTKELVVELAQLATVIKKSVLTSIKAETEKGPWKKLMLAFQKTLIKDLDEDQFADVIAQTVSYGLLTARLSSDGQISLKNLVDMVPSTNPFLKELLQHFLSSAGMKGLFDVDEAGINDVVELLNRANAQAIRNDFGKKTDGEDPVIHFYEHFLGAYNKKLKVERGVFYTPKPIVSYIVRSVHELLQNEFGLEDGLADTSTWEEVQKKNNGLKIPEGIKDPKIEPFVQILDPATGTATFLIEVIDVIHNTMVSKWEKEHVSKTEQINKWNAYVPTHLLPRLYAYELMMAPYAIAHMKVGLKLNETGFTAWEKLGPENRANIFLTNALEPWTKQLELPGFDALAHESAAVNEVKKNVFFTVAIGNPPYQGFSANTGAHATGLVTQYRYCDNKPIGERNPSWLLDDYVKFLSMGQGILMKTGCGILSMITNNGYIDNPTFRGMRDSLLKSFDQIRILNLNGDAKKKMEAPDGGQDSNVFDIQQGVSIGIFTKNGVIPKIPVDIRHSNLWGQQKSKLAHLKSTQLSSTSWDKFESNLPFRLFRPTNVSLDHEFNEFISLNDLFVAKGWGFKTRKDYLLVDFNKEDLSKRFTDIAKLAAKDAKVKYSIDESEYWDFEAAHKQLPKDPTVSIRPVLFRPFDVRSCFYEKYMIERGDHKYELMSQMFRPNLALVTVRRNESNRLFDHVFCTRLPAVLHSVSAKEANFFFPFLRHDSENDPKKLGQRDLFNSSIAEPNCKLAIRPEGDISNFNYVYAVLYSPGYRARYAEQLRIDFPRLPKTKNMELFTQLAKLGGELISLHLLESEKLAKNNPRFICDTNSKPEVDKVTWSNNCVWIDKAKKTGFKEVKEETWNFHIGGYQVCEKWLKDRKGRKLTKDDIEHYQKIVVALSETIRLMAEIDKVIDEHGGWPGAFRAAK